MATVIPFSNIVECGIKCDDFRQEYRTVLIIEEQALIQRYVFRVKDEY